MYVGSIFIVCSGSELFLLCGRLSLAEVVVVAAGRECSGMLWNILLRSAIALTSPPTSHPTCPSHSRLRILCSAIALTSPQTLV